MNNDPVFQIGVVDDTRDEVEKLSDFKQSELVSAFVAPVWKEKTLDQCRNFPIFNQDGSGSCVAQTMAKLLGINYYNDNGTYVHFSATHIYQRRANKPSSGMGGIDVFEIARKGVTLEELVPSQNMSDTAMDSTEIASYKQQVGEIFKSGNYIFLNNGDIDQVASTIEATKKGVMIWIFAQYDEWTEVPAILNPSLTKENAPIRHSIAVVDYMLYNGKKALVIEDSWGVGYGKGGRRIITEDFFKARNYFAGYVVNFKFGEVFVPVIEKPYYFNMNMQFVESTSDPLHLGQKDEVIQLQKVLQKQGYFPSNVDCTGYYGAITAKAVLAYQIANRIDDIDTLKKLKGHYFGGKSRDFINKTNK